MMPSVPNPVTNPNCAGSVNAPTGLLVVVEVRKKLTRNSFTVVLLGMPGEVKVDLTGLWQREVSITGAYAYATEGDGRRTFDLAFELVNDAGLERLVSATYPLERYREAIEHAANAGRRGAVKVAFDLRKEKKR